MIHQSKRKAYKTERFNTFQTQPFCAKLCPCRHYTAKPGLDVKAPFHLCIMKSKRKETINVRQCDPICAGMLKTRDRSQTPISSLRQDHVKRTSNHNPMAEETKKTEEKDQGIPSWLLPVLTGLASMGGNYILWIKPLQDAFKKLSDEIEDLREEVKDLKRERKEREEREELDGLEDDGLLKRNHDRSFKRATGKRNITTLR
jgi:hypothetical protein